LVAVLVAGALANVILDDLTLGNSFASPSITINPSSITLANGQIISFLNAKPGSTVQLGSKTVTCKNAASVSCGIVFNQATEDNYALSLDVSNSLYSITSGQDNEGNWHVYAGGQVGGAITVTLNGSNIDIQAGCSFILQFSTSLELEKVVTFTSGDVMIEYLTMFNKQLLAFVKARKTPSAFINGNKELPIDVPLGNRYFSLVATTNFDGESLILKKINEFTTTTVSADYIDVKPLDSTTTMITVSYLLSQSSCFNISTTQYCGTSSSHPYFIVIRATSQGETDFNIVTTIDGGFDGSRTSSLLLLDSKTIVASLALFQALTNAHLIQCF